MRHCFSRRCFVLLILCALWYSASSANNVVGKHLLNHFPYPFTVTLVQLIAVSLLSAPVLHILKLPRKLDLCWTYYAEYIIPLAFGKFVAVALSHISIWKVPVSYAHTLKATMPLFTVVLSRILLKEKHTLKLYLSLVPIILGASIATLTELSFDLIGLISALLSTGIFALQQIYSKKVMRDKGVHHFQLLYVLAKFGFFMFLPLWGLVDGLKFIQKGPSLFTDGEMAVRTTIGLLALDGFLNWIQNMAAFRMLSLVSPLTYSVANSTKRIAVIGLSIVVIGNAVTVSNAFGMIMAVGGVFMYNKVKYDERIRGESPSEPLRNVLVEPIKELGDYFPLVQSVPVTSSNDANFDQSDSRYWKDGSNVNQSSQTTQYRGTGPLPFKVENKLYGSNFSPKAGIKVYG